MQHNTYKPLFLPNSLTTTAIPSLTLPPQLPFETVDTVLANVPPVVHTAVNLIMSDPASAMLASRLPADGVGLVRMEFLLSNIIRVHPLALFRYPKYVDELTADAISNILEANGYDSSAPDVGETFFQNTVCEGIATMAAAFHPRPVVIRLSDFKSNEYRGLIGGVAVEDEEENPMLGLYVLRTTHCTPALTRNHTRTH